MGLRGGGQTGGGDDSVVPGVSPVGPVVGGPAADVIDHPFRDGDAFPPWSFFRGY